MNFGDFFLPQKSLKMRDVLEKMRECGKLPNLRDFPHDCGMVDTYGLFVIHFKNKRDAIYIVLFHSSPGAIPASMIPTPIPANLDYDSNSSRLGYDSDSDSNIIL